MINRACFYFRFWWTKILFYSLEIKRVAEIISEPNWELGATREVALEMQSIAHRLCINIFRFEHNDVTSWLNLEPLDRILQYLRDWEREL